MKLIPNRLRQLLETSLGPLVDGLIVARVNPNTLTTIGFLTLVASAVAFGFAQIRLGGGLLLLSGVMDMLDGRVARGGGGMSKFGAFYDSTLDRVGEAALMTGITVFFMNGGVPAGWAVWAVLASTIAMASGIIVSYARARAEGLMLECEVGLVQRAERILGLGVPTMFFGAGRDGILLLSIVTILGLLAVVTIIQRINHVYNLTRSAAPEPPSTVPLPNLADPLKERAKR
jgi:CDP-diacylglycerol--glycerol-3-phosphate 3-phosphatidyltransferase